MIIEKAKLNINYVKLTQFSCLSSANFFEEY